MKKHLLLTCLAYLFFGVGITLELIGFKAEIDPLIVLISFMGSLIFFVVVVFTSMQKIKEVLFKN